MTPARTLSALTLILLLGGASAEAEPGARRTVTRALPAFDIASWNYLPGEFAIRPRSGNYVTALGGGGLPTEPTVTTAATIAKPWEKFRIAVADPAPHHDKAIQTSSGNFLTAVGGGGRISDVLHTDATVIRDWERFRINDLTESGVAPSWFAIQTIRNNFLTAVGEGGKYDDAFHSDATQLGSWEHLRIVKCGDLGDGNEYTILDNIDRPLTATDGGGLDKRDPIVTGFSADKSWSRFKFLQQGDGSYALQTANGVNFLTALGGGGLVQKYFPPDCGLFEACIGGFSKIFHTDATQVLGWEKFRFVDTGNCKYTIQTTSGFFVGIYKGRDGYMLLTTRRTQITENEKFQLIMHGLASPVVIQ
jgi:hypothetical protein